MNPIDDLLKYLSTNPSASNSDLWQAFPQLKGNDDLTKRVKAYGLGKLSMKYGDGELEDAFPDVVKTFNPKSTSQVAAQPVQRPVQSSQSANQESNPYEDKTLISGWLSHGKTWDKNPSINPNSEDPLGDLQKYLYDQSGNINEQLTNLTKNHAGSMLDQSYYGLNAQKKQIFQASDNLQDIATKTGLNVSTPQAANTLNSWVKATNPDADINNMSIQEIEKHIPNTLTAKAVLKRYENNKNVFDSFQNSPSLETSALKWAATSDPNLHDQIIKMTDGTYDPSKVPSSMMGKYLDDFLQQPAAKEWAQQSQNNLNAYQSAKTNLIKRYPDYGETEVAGKINQLLEDEGHNNSILTPVPKDLDQRVDNWVRQGKLSPQEAQLYKTNNANIRIKIDTPGLLSSAAGGFKDVVANTAMGAADLERSAVGLGASEKDRLFDKNDQDYQQTEYDPTPLHKWISEVGNFGGQAAGLAFGASALKGMGFGTRLANGLSFALSAEKPIRDEAVQKFPDDPDKQNGYTALMLGVNGALGSLVGREKALDGLDKLVSPEVKKDFQSEVLQTINQFTAGKISSDAAKQVITGGFNKILDKLPEYGKATLKHNLSMSGQMAALTGIQDVADNVFGAKDYSPSDIGQHMLSTAKLAFITGAPLSFLAAHSDITSASKLGAGAVSEIVSDPLRYNALVDNLAQTDGEFSKKANDIKNNIALGTQIKSDMDSNPQFEGMSREDKQKYLFQSLAQKVNEEKLKTTTDNVLRNKLKEQIKQSEAFNSRLLTGDDLDIKEPSKADKDNGVKAYYEDKKNIPDLADKIIKGHPLTDEDLQLQQNFPEELEKQLNKKVKFNQDAVPVESPNGADVRSSSGNSSEVGKGNEEEAPVNENTSPSQEKIIKEQPYTTSSGKYSVDYKDGKRVVIDNTTKQIVPEYNGARKNKIAYNVLKEHDESYQYNHGEKADASKAPRFSNPDEADKWVVDNSHNPSEVADVYARTPKESSPLSSVEQVIADHGIGKIKEASYREFGDVNNINNAKARSYLNSKGRNLDVIAKEISDHTGLDVHPEDIVNFIDRFPNGVKQALAARDGEVRQAAASKFKDLTGIDITERIAMNASKQGYEEKVVEPVLHKILKSEALPEDELAKWLREESAKDYDDNENNNNLDYGPTTGQHPDDSANDHAFSPANEHLQQDASTAQGSNDGQGLSKGNDVRQPESSKGTGDSERPGGSEPDPVEASPEEINYLAEQLQSYLSDPVNRSIGEFKSSESKKIVSDKSEYREQLEEELKKLRGVNHRAKYSEKKQLENEKNEPKTVSALVKKLTSRFTDDFTKENKAEAFDARKKYQEEKRELRSALSRERGDNWVIEKLSKAARNDDISQEAADFGIDLIRKNPDLFKDLAISITKNKSNDITQGFYNSAAQLVKIFKGSNELTPVHELLHHTERFLPEEIRQNISKEWSNQLDSKFKEISGQLKNELDKDKRQRLSDSLDFLYLAQRNANELNVSKSAEIEKLMNEKIAKINSNEFYKYYNASEWWAVNASELFKKNIESKQPETWLQKVKYWYSQLLQSAKKIFGFDKTASVEKGLNAVLGGKTLTEMQGSQISKTQINKSIDSQADAKVNHFVSNKLGTYSDKTIHQILQKAGMDEVEAKNLIASVKQKELLKEGSPLRDKLWRTAGNMLGDGRTDSQVLEFMKRKGIPDDAALAVLGDAKTNPFTPQQKEHLQAEAIKEYDRKEKDMLGDKAYNKLENQVEARDFQDRIKGSVPKGASGFAKDWKNVDMAIHIYLDSQRNPEHIKQYYDKLSPDQKKLVDLSQNLSPEQKKIAEDISEQYKQLGQSLVDTGILDEAIPNYVSRAWEMKGKPATEENFKFSTSTRHTKDRQLDTILQGMAEGMKLKINGASNNLAALKNEIGNLQANRKLLSEGLSIKDSEGNPLFTTTAKEGYKKIESPYFKKWDFSGKISDYPDTGDSQALGKRKDIIVSENGHVFKKSDVYAPKEVAQSLNNITGTSKLNDDPFWKGFTKFNAAVKQSILSFSGFHFVAFTRAHMLAGKMVEVGGVSPRASYKRGIELIQKLDPELKELVKGGLTLSREQDFTEGLSNHQTWLGDKMDKLALTKIAKDKVLALNHSIHKFLFQTYGAGLKAYDAVNLYRSEKMKHPSEDPKQIAERVGKAMNDTYGGINWDRMSGTRMQDPTFRHKMSLLFLAPDWTSSNLRFAKKAFEKGDEGALYRGMWGKVVLRGVMATALLNAGLSMMDDTDEDGNKLPWWEAFTRRYSKAWEQGHLRWLMVDVTPLYHMAGGSEDKRAYFSIFGAYTDPVRMVLNPGDFLQNKGSFVVKGAKEAMTSQNWQHKEFTTADELFGIDDKGVYTKNQFGHMKGEISPTTGLPYRTNLGNHVAGENKGGKLEGQLVKPAEGGAHSLNYSQLPSFVGSQVRGMMPTALQSLWQMVSGENGATETVLNAGGTGIVTGKEK